MASGPCVKLVALGLSDFQLSLVQEAVGRLSSEYDRAKLLRLIDAQLKTRTIDLEDAIERAERALDVGAESYLNGKP
jgi:hypothetical protein